jgi:RNA polymerase-binding transcription factor DksA
MAATKKAPDKKAPAKKVPANKGAAKSTARPAGHKPAAKKAPVSRAPAKPATAKRTSGGSTAAKRAPASKAPAKKAPAATRTRPTSTSTSKSSTSKNSATVSKTSPTKSSARFGTPTSTPGGVQLPEPRGVSKDGIAYTKDFDVKFLKAQRDLLDEEKAKLMGQATRLENEANSLIEEAEMGDVQFDDEGGEGDTMVVERERDLALSAQARQTIADIDEALARLEKGTYGYSEASGRPIPRERLEAIPWATVLVEEKVGGIGRR